MENVYKGSQCERILCSYLWLPLRLTALSAGDIKSLMLSRLFLSFFLSFSHLYVYFIVPDLSRLLSIFGIVWRIISVSHPSQPPKITWSSLETPQHSEASRRFMRPTVLSLEIYTSKFHPYHHQLPFKSVRCIALGTAIGLRRKILYKKSVSFMGERTGWTASWRGQEACL